MTEESQMVGIVLPWPPAELSGHNNGNKFAKNNIIKKHRREAFEATKKARIMPPAKGDILICVDFYPPNNLSDRINYWNRCKPYFDGMADAMGVNDKRFMPAGYRIRENIDGGRVDITVSAPP